MKSYEQKKKSYFLSLLSITRYIIAFMTFILLVFSPLSYLPIAHSETRKGDVERLALYRHTSNGLYYTHFPLNWSAAEEKSYEIYDALARYLIKNNLAYIINTENPGAMIGSPKLSSSQEFGDLFKAYENSIPSNYSHPDYSPFYTLPDILPHSPKPDIVITNLNVPSQGIIGGFLPSGGSITVANKGDADIGNAHFRINFFWSLDSIITKNDAHAVGSDTFPLGMDYTQGIKAGSSKTISFSDSGINIFLQRGWLTAKSYYLGAIADYYDEVSESDENNNIFGTGPITIAASSAPTPNPEPPVPEETISMNTGVPESGGTGSNNWYVGLHINGRDYEAGPHLDKQQAVIFAIKSIQRYEEAGIIITETIYQNARGLPQHPSPPSPPSPPAPTNSVDISVDGNLTIAHGRTGVKTVTANISAWKGKSATFTVQGLPTGASGKFSPSSCDRFCSTTLTIITSPATPINHYEVDMTATRATVSDGARFTLTITQQTKPNAPSNLTATVLSSSQIQLNWIDTADNDTAVRVERTIGRDAMDNPNPPLIYSKLAQDQTSYTDTGLSSNTQYCYRVSVTNDDDYSNPSEIACAITQSASLYQPIVTPQPPSKSLPIILTVAGIDPKQTLLPGDFSQPFKDPMYLQSSLISFLKEKNLSNEVAPIDVFLGWRDGDITGTKIALENLKKDIQVWNAYAKKRGALFNIVAHSWGTVLTYAALTELANADEDIRVDNLFTLGSPIGYMTDSKSPIIHFVGLPKNPKECQVTGDLKSYEGILRYVRDAVCLHAPDSIRAQRSIINPQNVIKHWYNYQLGSDLFAPTPLPFPQNSSVATYENKYFVDEDGLIPEEGVAGIIKTFQLVHRQYYDWQGNSSKLTAWSTLHNIVGKILNRELPLTSYPSPNPIIIPTSPGTSCEQILGVKCPITTPGTIPAPPGAVPINPSPVSTDVFTYDLYRGMTANGVGVLQKFLKQQGFFPAGVKTTNYFGKMTKQAAQKFQIYYGIIPSDGYVGSATRAKLNALLPQ